MSDSQQKIFEDLLKKSHYFQDVIGTQRRGMTYAISAITKAIIEQEPSIEDSIINKLRDADVRTGSDSIDVETRRITKVLIDDILDATKQRSDQITRPQPPK